MTRTHRGPMEPRRWRRRITWALLRPVDGAGLAVVRAAFGLIVVWEVWRYVDRGWIARYYQDPTVRLRYPLVPWVDPLPGVGMEVVFAALAVAGLMVAVGLWYRWSAPVLAVLLGYVFLLEASRYLNHVYLMVLLASLLAVVPAHRTWSVDAWLGRRQRPVPAWAPGVLRLQVGIMYAFAAVAKLNTDWLSGQPMERWLRSRGDLPVIGPLTQLEHAPLLFSYGGLLVDLVAVPGLLWRPTRGPTFALLVLFHLTNDQVFSIGVFPWLAIAVTTVFFDPAWPRALGLGRRARPERGVSRPRRRRVGIAEGAAVAVLGAFALTQLGLPLRHHLYASDVAWSEEGHRFSWRMMLRSKRGDLRFAVIDPAGGSHVVDARDYLAPFQVGQATTRPDLILQLAHHVARDFERQGHDGVAVHALAYVSLNGRPAQLLIDPFVDLTQVRWSVRAASWILPEGGRASAETPKPTSEARAP